MKWFANLRISVKLITSFTIVAFIAGVIGLVGYLNINDLGNVSMPSVNQVNMIKTDMTQVSAMSNMLLSTKLAYEEKLDKYGEIDKFENKLLLDMQIYNEMAKTDEELALWTKTETSIMTWLEGVRDFNNLSKSLTEKGIDDPAEVRYQIALKQRDHLSWIWTLSENIRFEESFTGQLDGSKCALGIWLDSYNSRNSILEKNMIEIRAAHLEVHSSGSRINDLIESDIVTKQIDAFTIYDNITAVKMAEVLSILISIDDIAKVSDDIFGQMIIMALTVNEPEYDVAAAEIDKMIDLTVRGADSSVTSAGLLLLMLSVIGIVLSIVLGLFISRIITKPINKILEFANEIAKGNLDIAIDIDTKDEVGELAKAFRLMTENINEVMTNINSASEQVASGSRQVSESSMSLSQGATEQASSIEELTASIEQIAAQTRQNATNANKAEEVATLAQKNAQQGNSQMADMLKSMEEINDSSNNINKIIKVIDDIAFQTNILALNAAVEAARAGQHGKGFAVVAEEVRNLAARSASAAKETTAMIEGSIKKVEGGTKIANETAKALNLIVEGVSEATQLVGQIAIASGEQALGVDQVNQGIMQISDVVQTTSATAEETAAASEELSGQADMLKSQVSTFKLRKSNQFKRYSNEGVDPEVLKMLANMKNTEQSKKKTNTTKKISLNDSDFEKYQ